MTEALVPQLDREMVRLIHDTTKSRALALHGAVMDRLQQILYGADDKAAMTAAGLILKLGGSMKAPSVKVQVSFDDLMKQSAIEAGPLHGLTQIAEASIVDAEDEYSDSENQ